MFSRLFTRGSRNTAANVSGKSCSIETLERRQHLSTSILDSKIKVAMLTGDDGTGIASSRVTVRFATNITLLDPTKFRMFGFKTDTTSPNLAQKKQTINITNVDVGADGNKLVFTTDRRVRKGAQLIAYAGAIADGASAPTTTDLIAKLPKGLNKERFTLASRSFVATNLAFFNNSIFSSAPAVTATPTSPSSGTVTTNLNAYLDAKVNAGTLTTAQRTTALARFNDATTTSIVPNANLRAAMASLVGTVGEPAIEVMLTSANPTNQPFTVVDFSSEVSGGAVVAETKVSATTGRLRTLFKTSLQGEPFQVLATFLAHEALHTDNPNSQNEEIFANYVQTSVWAQNVLAQPSIVGAGTQLVTENNLLLMAALNSGDALYPRSRVKNAPLIGGQNVFPNANVPSTTYTSYQDYVRKIYQARNFGGGNTNAPPVATTYSNLITGRADTGTFTFSTARFDTFDNSQQILSDRASVQLAGALRLATR